MGADDRLVVFLVHLPHGVAGRERFLALDLHAPWAHVFVDQVHPVPDGQLPTIE